MKKSKPFRKAVFEKFGGHCAYCGKKLATMQQMQMDHIIPKQKGGPNTFENLNPSCRRCNHYKRNLSLESFRNWMLAGLIDRLKKDYIVKVAIDYGMIQFKPWDKVFYFEKISEQEFTCQKCGSHDFFFTADIEEGTARLRSVQGIKTCAKCNTKTKDEFQSFGHYLFEGEK